MRRVLYYISDIHLERNNVRNVIKNLEARKTLLKSEENNIALAGDISIIRADHFKNLEYFQLLTYLSYNYENIFTVTGNHEYDELSISTADEILTDLTKSLSNVYILKRKKFILGEYKISGCTLWTPDKNMEEYIKDRDWLEGELLNDMKNNIIISHYIPSYKLLETKYSHLKERHKYYYNNLDYLMENSQNAIKYWLCGHTHSSLDIPIGYSRCCINSYESIGFTSRKIYLD